MMSGGSSAQSLRPGFLPAFNRSGSGAGKRDIQKRDKGHESGERRDFDSVFQQGT